MSHLRKRYRQMADGGAVPADEPAPASASEALKAQIEAMRQAPEVVEPQEQPDGLEAIDMPPLAKQWLRKNPEYLQDERKNERLQSLHWELVGEGFEGYSPEYYTEVDRRLNAPAPKDHAVARALEVARAHAAETEEFSTPGGNRLRISAREDVDRISGSANRSAIVSAPPSREPPSSGGVSRHMSEGTITLTREQREAARVSGISEKEYAFQLLKLREAQARGEYQGRP